MWIVIGLQKKLKLERLKISEAEICITKSNTDY